MSDRCEAEDGQLLAYEEAAKLHAMKPGHELLRYVLRPDNDEVWEEFISRFGKPNLSREAQKAAPAIAYTYATYWLALREACADPEKPIVVNHGPSKPAAPAKVPPRLISSSTSVDDGLPF